MNRMKKIMGPLLGIVSMFSLAGCVNTEAKGSTSTSQPEMAKDYPVDDAILNSGHKMPVIGIGTYTLSNDVAENSAYYALKYGMRLIDTARIYGNEEGVGRGI